MGGVADAVGGFVGDVVGGLTGTKAAAEGAERAAGTQAQAAQQGIQEQRRQFDALVKLMQPFVGAAAGSDGVTGSLGAQQALLGLLGPDAQMQAISGLEQSPQFQSLVQQGESALLQNASATGGLRGGNLQGALAQYRPQVLSQLIESQFNKLGGLTQLGQASAAGQASAGLQTGSNIGNLLQQKGAATAGGQLAMGGQQQAAIGSGLGLAKGIAGFF